ncbi:hypothetical protein EMCRGX_G025207 [Ephydatia muelleri]|eukprot:Em0021g51a
MTAASSTMLQSLSTLERELVCAVLEDCVDQLAVLGGIAPNYVEKPSAVESVMGEELVHILETQRQMENKFEELALDGAGGKMSAKEVADSAQGIFAATEVARSSKAVTENMQKLQEDRAFLQSLLQQTLKEVCAQGTFTILLEQVKRCQEDKLEMEKTILREEQSRKRVKELRKQKAELKKEKEKEIGELNEQIAHLKDQLQEWKAKTGLEANYVKKERQVSVEVQQRHHTLDVQAMEEEVSTLKQKIEEEKKVSESIEEYLKTHYEELDGQVDHWMAAYEQDLEMKTSDVQEIKTLKAAGLQRYNELATKYKEYEDVVVEHRAMKEKQRIKAEQDMREGKAATKLQAWWKGMMVRKGLGPYKKETKKGKKGKKGKKKGKKGKK